MTNQEIIAVVQAAIEGKKIEWRWKDRAESPWMETLYPGKGTWDFEHLDYRVKREPRTWWVNVYPDWSYGFYHSKQAADNCAGHERTECVRVCEVME